MHVQDITLYIIITTSILIISHNYIFVYWCEMIIAILPYDAYKYNAVSYTIITDIE